MHKDAQPPTGGIERFLDCGDLHKGFARVYCDQCGHDYLLAYSCKTRYFCPSCHHKFAGSEFGRMQCARRVRARDGAHQKRMLAYGEWLENVVGRYLSCGEARLIRGYSNCGARH